jgi:GT2 family glycosyltransferase
LNSASVSVVIATRDRAAKLAETLAGLTAQTISSNCYDIVVVDDGSTPPVMLRQSGPVPSRLVRLNGAGRSAARNAGAWAASGDVLAFVDDDISVQPDFLEQHLDAQRRWPGALVVGAIRLPADALRTRFGRFRQRLEDSSVPIAPGPVDMSNLCTAANMSMARRAFLELGGFDAGLASAEDQDLALRHTAHGGRIVFWPAAKGIHQDDALDLRRYCRRSERGMAQMVEFCRRYPERGDSREREIVNGSLRFGKEPLTLSARKVVKSILANRLALETTFIAARIVDRCGTEAMSNRLYQLLLGIHLQRGYRSGRGR